MEIALARLECLKLGMQLAGGGAAPSAVIKNAKELEAYLLETPPGAKVQTLPQGQRR